MYAHIHIHYTHTHPCTLPHTRTPSHSTMPTPTPTLPHTHTPTSHPQTSQPGSLSPHNGEPCGLHSPLPSGLSGSQLSPGEGGPSLHTGVQLQSAYLTNGLHHILRQDHWEEVCVCVGQLSHLEDMLCMLVAGVQLLHL